MPRARIPSLVRMAASLFALICGLMLPERAAAAGCTVTLKADGNTAAIQHAMDLPGTPVVCLRSGIYTGARLMASKNAIVRNIGKERAVLDAGSQGRVLTVQQDGIHVTLEGLTLTQGTALQGGAIALTQASRLTLRDCWLTQNRATLHGGGAIYARAGRLELIRTRVTHNAAERASAMDLTGNVQVRLVNTLIVDNNTLATGDAPVRLSGDAKLDLVQSTVAYNGGHGVFLQPGGPGISQLRIDSSIVMGKPEAVAVLRSDANRVQIFRSVLHGGSGFVALDLQTVRGLPGFNLVDAERYRPQAGSPAIGRGRCVGPDAGLDAAGVRRPTSCTAGALEAPAAEVRQTLRDRQVEARKKPKEDPW